MTDTSRSLNILAVVAHPHDITHMCGTLAHHVDDGDSVTAVAMTGGLHTHREKLYDELRKPPGERNLSVINQTDQAYSDQKAHEMSQVCALFGVTDVRILPFSDSPFFEVTPEAVETLGEIIYEVRPHLVLTHGPCGSQRHGIVDLTPEDHHNTGIVLRHALRRVGTPDPVTQRTPHRVSSIYYTGVDFKEADLFIDIWDQAANRVKAEMLFLSQGQTPEFSRKRIEIGVGNMGWQANVAYAEPWVRARPQLTRRLTVTEEEIELAEMPQEEMFAALSRMPSDEDLK